MASKTWDFNGKNQNCLFSEWGVGDLKFRILVVPMVSSIKHSHSLKQLYYWSAMFVCSIIED